MASPTFALQPPPEAPLAVTRSGPGATPEIWVTNTWQTWFALLQRTNITSIIINVIDFGADPSGVSDSLAAFNAALAYAVSTGRGAVYVPGGDYLLDGSLEIPEDIMLYGDGEKSKLIRGASITGGVGWIDMPNPGSVIYRLQLEGMVTTPTGLQYGAGTTGSKFDNDPMNAKLTDNTSVWIRGSRCKVYDCIIRHTGGYAVLIDSRAANLSQVEVSRNLFENNRPHLFGTTLGQLIYGSWTGGIHGQGQDDGVNTFTLSDCLICENRISRTTGIGIYIEHAYGFNAQATTVTIADNILETVGLDGIELGNCTGFVIAGNNLRRGGVTTLTDSDTPVPRYLANAYAVGIDTSGLAQYGTISGNSVMNWNGACYDHDGLCDSNFASNSGSLSQPGEPAYTEDDVANFGLGAGPICYGMQTSNTQANDGGENVSISANSFRGMTAGAIRIYCGRNCTVTANTIWHPAAPFSPPVLIGNVASTTAKRSANVNVFGNTIYYDPSGIGPCVVEDQALGTFSGTEPNFVWGNRCIGNCYEFLAAASSNSSTEISFPSNSPSLTTQQDFVMQNTGVGVSAAFRFYTIEGTSVNQVGQFSNYRSLIDRDSIFNASLDGGTSTGIISTGDWVTFGFGNIMATGWNFNRAAYVALDYQNAYSDFTDPKADLLTDDYALIRYKKGTGFQQSITTSAGARVWTAFSGGGSPGGSNTQIQYNNSGSFGGSANNIWNNAAKQQTITGATGTAGLKVLTAFVDSAEGFYTAASNTDSIQSPTGGVTAKYLITTESANWVAATLPAVSSSGQARIVMDTATNTLKASVNAGAYFTIGSGAPVGPTTAIQSNAGGGVFYGDAGLLYDPSNGRVWITNAAGPGQLIAQGTTGGAVDLLSAATGCYVAGHANWSGSAMTTGSVLFSVIGSGSTGVSTSNSGLINFVAESNWGSGSAPTYINFLTAPSGSATAVEGMRLNSQKHLLIGSTTDNSTGAPLQVTGAVTSSGLFNSAATGSSLCFQGNGGNFQVDGNGNLSGAAVCNFVSGYQVNGSTAINSSNVFVGASVNTAGGITFGGASAIIQGATTRLNSSGQFVGVLFNATNTGASITFQNSSGNFQVDGNGNISGNGDVNMNGVYKKGGVSGISATKTSITSVTISGGIITAWS